MREPNAVTERDVEFGLCETRKEAEGRKPFQAYRANFENRGAKVVSTRFSFDQQEERLSMQAHGTEIRT